jgi:hypothetical protein
MTSDHCGLGGILQHGLLAMTVSVMITAVFFIFHHGPPSGSFQQGNFYGSLWEGAVVGLLEGMIVTSIVCIGG